MVQPTLTDLQGSAPRLTLGLRPGLLESKPPVHRVHRAGPVHPGAQEGTSASFHRAGVSVYAPRLPVGFRRLTFLRHRFLR